MLFHIPWSMCRNLCWTTPASRFLKWILFKGRLSQRLVAHGPSYGPCIDGLQNALTHENVSSLLAGDTAIGLSACRTA